ncbi:MAG: SpaA isopeptide-forming pilin-related protein [Peptostreptococcaceae bacterium]|nr:SpaA isopeptide-forming pilin-related protein [Peptostreptococcaceae bacterium]
MRKNTIISLCLIFVLFFTSIFSKTIAFAINENEQKRNVAGIISNIDFTYKGYDKELHKIERWVEFQINVHWDAKHYNSQLQQNDYFEITFPENIHLTKVPEYETGIRLKKKIGGTTYHIATIYLQTDGKDFLQKMTVIFQDDVKKLKELKGTIHAFATFPNTDIIKVNEDNIFPIAIEGREPITKTYYLNYTPKNVKNEIISKWEELHRSDRKNRSFGWFGRVNVAKRDLQGATIIDRLQTPGSYFDSDKGIVLSCQGFNEVGERIHLDTNGQRLIPGVDYDLTYSADKKEMRIHIKSDALNGKSAALEYWTKYGENINYIKNHIQIRMGDILMLERENNRAAESEYDVHGIGGITATIDGTDTGLLLIEVADENTQVLLNGAAFLLKKDNVLIAELVTGAYNKGQVYSGKLSPGDYTLQETRAPKGYLSDDTVIPIKIHAGQETQKTIKKQKDLEETASISILKTDESNNPLDDAEFTIFKDGAIVDTIRTGSAAEKGSASTKKLSPGRYTIQETKSPEGFMLSDETIVLDLERNDQKKLTVINKAVPSESNPSTAENEVDNPNADYTPKVEEKNEGVGQLVIIKKDAQSGKSLSGAEFKISHSNQEIGSFVTDENGAIILENPEAGRYLIQEMAAPENYHLHDKAELNQVEMDIELQKQYIVTFKNLKNIDTAQPEPSRPIIETEAESAPSNSESSGNEYMDYNFPSPVRPDIVSDSISNYKSEQNIPESKNDANQEKTSEKQILIKDESSVNPEGSFDSKNNHSEISQKDTTTAISSDGIALHGRERTNSEKTLDESDIDNDGIPHSNRDKDKKSVSRIASTPKTGMRIDIFDISFVIIALLSLITLNGKSKNHK